MAFRTRADLQNQAIGWLRKGYSSLGGGTVVRFPRIWMSSGECRIEELWEVNEDGTFGEKLPGTPPPGILLRPTDYKLVKVFKENTDG